MVSLELCGYDEGASWALVLRRVQAEDDPMSEVFFTLLEVGVCFV